MHVQQYAISIYPDNAEFNAESINTDIVTYKEKMNNTETEEDTKDTENAENVTKGAENTENKTKDTKDTKDTKHTKNTETKDTKDIENVEAHEKTKNIAVEEFVVIHKNARSLTNNSRLEELVREPDTSRWDAILINETWRLEQKEFWKTRWGHIFTASGHAKNTRGVAILLHSRWSHAIMVHFWKGRLCQTVEVPHVLSVQRFSQFHFSNSVIFVGSTLLLGEWPF